VHLEAAGLPLLSVVRHDEAYQLSEDRVTVGVTPGAIVLYSADKGENLGYGA
jgi:hypothetical protein